MAPNNLMEIIELLTIADEIDLVDDLLPLLVVPDQKPTTYDDTKPKRTLEDFSNAQCKDFFRFYKNDIYRLANALRIPERFVLSNRCVEDGVQALVVFLARMAYPNRLTYLEFLFNRPKTTISMIIQAVLDHIYDNFSDKISNLAQREDHFQEYADVIHAKGAPLKNCIGFVDGTVRPLCRPVRFQRTCYNGHKRVHAIKFQSVVTPDGLISHLYGPIEGRRHDSPRGGEG